MVLWAWTLLWALGHGEWWLSDYCAAISVSLLYLIIFSLQQFYFHRTLPTNFVKDSLLRLFYFLFFHIENCLCILWSIMMHKIIVHITFQVDVTYNLYPTRTEGILAKFKLRSATLLHPYFIGFQPPAYIHRPTIMLLPCKHFGTVLGC